MIRRDNFCKFCIKTHVVTLHLNCLVKTVQMRGHKIWLRNRKNYPSVIIEYSLFSTALYVFVRYCLYQSSMECGIFEYSRLSLSRNRRNPQKQFEIFELRHIRFVVLRGKQFEQPIFTNDYVI